MAAAAAAVELFSKLLNSLMTSAHLLPVSNRLLSGSS